MSTSSTVGPSSYFDPSAADTITGPEGELLRRRLQALGPAYRLFYEEPVHIVQGQGAHLFDVDGVDYLDAYNNVACVGHANPRVSEAIANQAATLSTHTRYLHEGIVNYSEDLLSTFPDELAHVMYTCTGSEANDLALRIAKHHTGGTGIIVTRYAYHGVTTEIASISPSLGGIDTLASWATAVAAPDRYRVDTDDLGAWFAGQVREAIEHLQANGVRFAAFIADSVFSSDGVLVDPRGLLAPVLDVVHHAGGLYIADEVQAGFARTGDAMWGFDRHGTAQRRFLPDLVTIGKPMGNGMPVAAAVMRPEVIEAFGKQTRYFNTFGGNAVSMAAAQAVLDVINDDDILSNSQRVGASLQKMLDELATRHPAIGDVRGAGLSIGVEFVEPGTKEPDESLTRSVINGLRHRHVLIGATGPFNNVLKIRPPLVFTPDDADRLIHELDATLSELHP